MSGKNGSGAIGANEFESGEVEVDDDLFRSLVGDVKPIKTDKRVDLNPKFASRETPGLHERRRAAQLELPVDKNNLSGEFIEPVRPDDELSFQRPGVQHGVFRNLRLAKYRIDARLDLHRLSVEQARVAVYQFLNDCVEHDIRCVLITHGKGEERQPQPALLKSCVVHWLPQLRQVLAFHSAQKRHGGVGATYVLLRKSERKRQDNRERYASRRK